MSYQQIPTSSPPRSRTPQLPRPDSPTESHRPLRASVQAEFNRAPPAWWKRAILILGVVFMVWLTIKLGSLGLNSRKPEVIYASRYSEEFKYRPAASPVITEYLKDGRVRLRGASVGGVGIREEDLPVSPEKKREAEKKRVENAREEAKKKMGLKTRKGKGGKGADPKQLKTEM